MWPHGPYPPHNSGISFQNLETDMASSLSSVINQPHLAQRLKLHRPSSLTTFTIFHHKHKHQHRHNASFPHPYTSLPRSRPLNLIIASRTFSPSNTLHLHFIPQATLTASEAQPRWVFVAIANTPRLSIFTSFNYYRMSATKISFCFVGICDSLQFQWI